MVSVTGVDIKFGRIAAIVIVALGLIYIYMHFGSGRHKVANVPSVNGELNRVIAQVENSKEVQGESVSITANEKHCSVPYIQRLPSSNQKSQAVLLLHGQAFSPKTWLDIGTITNLTAWGYRVVAVEMHDCLKSFKTEDGELVLKELMDKLNLNSSVVLVSPSISGTFSIPYVIAMGSQHLSAFIPVAPVIKTEYAEKFKDVKVKTFIVHGEDDTGLGESSYNLLKNIPDSVDKKMTGGHPCYNEHPNEWHKILKEALDSIA